MINNNDNTLVFNNESLKLFENLLKLYNQKEENMNKNKLLKRISEICSLIGIIISTYGLIIGIRSINAEGLGQIGVIFIPPSILVLIVTLIDLVITIKSTKKGYIYSLINTLIKSAFMIYFLLYGIGEIKYQLQYNYSNLDFAIITLISLFIITIPSLLNTIRLKKNKTTK